ncbi:MAG: NAD-dependent epimerase/dehydratase family protein [Cyanobacteria bacterium K_Offshore_surface_m2_239]|nr:NAD-dependent epimerase/dehydratase family protein [Cyanobacteria bacterium K_Offshore_surface_m2_239]
MNTENVNADSSSADHRTVLVTGAAGFFGSHIAARFLRAGKNVVAFDKLNGETTSSDEKQGNLGRLRSLAQSIPGAEFSVFRGDVLDEASIREALEATSPTACVHAASMVDDRRSVSHPREYLTTNIIGTQTLLQTLAEHGSVRQVVYISTRSTFGQVDSPGQLIQEEAPKRPINPYGSSKVGAEAICHVYHHLHGIDLNIIRIFALYGPHGRPDMIPRQLMERVGAGAEIPKFGTGEANRDWMYVEDATEAVFLAAHKPMGYQIFNIGTGRGTSLNELIATAEDVIGKGANILHLPVPPGDAHFVGIADNNKARLMLGWEPKTSLRQGMQKTLEQMEADAADEA